MSGQYSKYPENLDDSSSLPIATDKVTPVKAEVVNRLRDAVLLIESELGIDPSSTFSTVRARLDALEQIANGGAVDILEEGVLIYNNAASIDFRGDVEVTIPQPLRVRVTVGSSTAQVQETIAVTSNGQTSFTLTSSPVQSNAVQMYVNGLKQQYGVTYFVSDTSVTYSGVALQTTDDVEFWYLIKTVALAGGGSGITPAKIKVYRNATFAGAAVTLPQLVTWTTESSHISSTNATFSGTDITVQSDGTYSISGQLTISPTVDAVSGITIEILQNGTVIHTVKDNGATWGIGIERSIGFFFNTELTAADTVSARWTHTGSAGSTTQLIAGETLTWLSVVRVN